MKRAKGFVIAAILSLLAVFCLIGCKPQQPPASEPVYYTVVINGESQQVKEGDKIAKPATDPTKSTSDADYDADVIYTFDGWYISGTNTAWNFDSDTVTKDITLVAKFSEQFNSTLIAPVVEAINALPAVDELTFEDEEDVTAAKEAFDALSESRKAQVNAELVTKLNGALEQIEQLYVAPVVDAITALPAVDDVTIADDENVTAAKEAYDALSESRKERVSAELVNKLNGAYDKIGLLYYIAPIEQQITALPAVDDVTIADENNIMKAKVAYDALSASRKAQVNAELVTKLNGALGKIDQYYISPVEQQITALPATDEQTLADEDDITAAKAAYDALSARRQAQVNAELVSKLTASLEKVEQLYIAAVEQQITALPAVAAVTLSDKEDIIAAKTAYNDLTESRKAQVSTELLSKLTALEAEFERLDEIDDSNRTFLGSADALRVPYVTLSATSNVTGYTVEYTVKSGSGTIEDNVLSVAGDATVVVIATYKYNTAGDATVKYTNVEHTEEAAFTFEQYTVTGTVTLNSRFTDETFTENTQIVIGEQEFAVNADGTYTAKIWESDEAVEVRAVNEDYLDGVDSFILDGDKENVNFEFKYLGMTLAGDSVDSAEAVIDYTNGSYSDKRVNNFEYGVVMNKAIPAGKDFKFSFTITDNMYNKAGVYFGDGASSFGFLYDYDPDGNLIRIFGLSAGFNATESKYNSFKTLRNTVGFTAVEPGNADTEVHFVLYRLGGEYFFTVEQNGTEYSGAPSIAMYTAINDALASSEIHVGLLGMHSDLSFGAKDFDLTLDYTDDALEDLYFGAVASAPLRTIKRSANDFVFSMHVKNVENKGNTYPYIGISLENNGEEQYLQFFRFNARWACVNKSGLNNYSQNTQLMFAGDFAANFNGGGRKAPGTGSDEPNFFNDGNKLTLLSDTLVADIMAVRTGAYISVYEKNSKSRGQYIKIGYVYLEGHENSIINIGGGVVNGAVSYGVPECVESMSFKENINKQTLFEITANSGRGTMMTYDTDFEITFTSTNSDGKGYWPTFHIMLPSFYKGVNSSNGDNLYVQISRFTTRWAVHNRTNSVTYSQTETLKVTVEGSGASDTKLNEINDVDASNVWDKGWLKDVKSNTCYYKLIRHGADFEVYEKHPSTGEYVHIVTVHLQGLENSPVGIGASVRSVDTPFLDRIEDNTYTKLEATNA